MIEAKEVLRLVRFKNKDNDEVEFSDYDIRNCLNEALRYISQSQALQNNEFLTKSAIYDESELNADIQERNDEIIASNPEYTEDDLLPLYNFQLNGIELPKDFQILLGVTRDDGYKMRPCDVSNIPFRGEYKIMGEKIYCGYGLFTITYQRTILPVKNMNSGMIDLPNYCLDLVVKITSMILNQAENDVMLQEIDNMVKSIVPRRKFNNARIKMPFVC